MGRQPRSRSETLVLGQRKHHHKRQARRHKGHEHHDGIDDSEVRLKVLPMLGRARIESQPSLLSFLLSAIWSADEPLSSTKMPLRRALRPNALIGALRHVKWVAEIVKRNVADFDLGDVERRILDLRRVARLNPENQLRRLLLRYTSPSRKDSGSLDSSSRRT